jgi:hypothetical protein
MLHRALPFQASAGVWPDQKLHERGFVFDLGKPISVLYEYLHTDSSNTSTRKTFKLYGNNLATRRRYYCVGRMRLVDITYFAP